MTGALGADVTLGVLAGGQSRRMGTDKALLPLEAGTLLDFVVTRYRGSGPVLISRAPGAAPVPWPKVEDPVSGDGPLRGIAALLGAVVTPWLCLVGCDQPYLPPNILSVLRAHVRSGDEGVLMMRDGGFVPLPALLHRDLGPRVERALARGARRALDWAQEARVHAVLAATVLGGEDAASESVNDAESFQTFLSRRSRRFDRQTAD